MIGRRSGRCGSGRKTIREVQKCSRDPSGGLEVVGRPFWRSGSGKDTLPEVGTHFQRSGIGRVTLPEVLKWSE